MDATTTHRQHKTKWEVVPTGNRMRYKEPLATVYSSGNLAGTLRLQFNVGAQRLLDSDNIELLRNGDRRAIKSVPERTERSRHLIKGAARYISLGGPDDFFVLGHQYAVIPEDGMLALYPKECQS